MRLFRLELGSLIVLVGACGRMGFDPLERELADAAPPPTQPPVVAFPDTCATARVISPTFEVLTLSMAGARDDVATTDGCGGGPELVLRFAESARGVPIQLEADFDGHYAIGTGCPVAASQTRLCGELAAEVPSSTMRLDVTPETYVLLSHPTGTTERVTILVGEAAL